MTHTSPPSCVQILSISQAPELISYHHFNFPILLKSISLLRLRSISLLRLRSYAIDRFVSFMSTFISGVISCSDRNAFLPDILPWRLNPTFWSKSSVIFSRQRPKPQSRSPVEPQIQRHQPLNTTFLSFFLFRIRSRYLLSQNNTGTLFRLLRPGKPSYRWHLPVGCKTTCNQPSQKRDTTCTTMKDRNPYVRNCKFWEVHLPTKEAYQKHLMSRLHLKKQPNHKHIWLQDFPFTLYGISAY